MQECLKRTEVGCHINASSGYGKFLTPRELEKIADGSICNTDISETPFWRAPSLEYPLDDALVAAWQDPTQRMNFYRVLNERSIFYLISKDGMLIFDQTTIGFTSPERAEQHITRSERADIQIGYFDALELLDTVKGLELILNPGPECRKRLTVPEIEQIRNASMFEMH